MNFIRNLFGGAQEAGSAAPSAEKLEEAKKIFFDYSCSGLDMARDDINLSSQYNISWKQQVAWRNEFIAEWRSRLSTDDLTAIRKLREATAVEVIPDLLAMVDQGDSYARLRTAEALWALSYSVKDKSLRKQVKAAAIGSAQSILARPIQLSETHRSELIQMGASDPEDFIISSAKEIK